MKFVILDNNYLAHHGTKGQKWGVRRFQNEDGTLTQEGKERYYNMMPTSAKRDMNRAYVDSANKRLQYIYDNKYKKVKGKDLKGSTADSSTLLGDYQEFKIGNVGVVAEKAVRGYSGTDEHGKAKYEEYDDEYPVFENSHQAAMVAKMLDSFPKGSYERAMFDADPNFMRAIYNTVMSEEVLRNYAMPTSAKQAQKETKKKEEEQRKKAYYESRMKSNIPASAWNQRVKELDKR